MNRHSRRIFTGLLSLFLLVSAISLTSCPTPDTGDGEPLPLLETVVFSIGKADAILLYGECGTVLIDTGEIEDGAEVLSFLRKKGISKIDALFLTHYDKDHVGGAPDILRSIEVTAVYGTYPSKESEEYDAYMAALAEKGLKPTVVRETTVLSFGNLTLTVYPPEITAYAEKESNNSSLAILARYGNHRFLFAGDAEEARTAELIATPGLEADFLKAPYHGNMTENFSALLSYIKPRYAAITCSDKNPEESAKTDALHAAGVDSYLTRHGNIYIRSDGRTLSVRQG